MSYHGHRRAARTLDIRPAANPLRDVWAMLRDRHVALRLLLCLLALVGMLVSVHASRMPFRYRMGQQPAHGIGARLDFEIPNFVATERARDEAAGQVARIFRHDPKPLEKLPDSLGATLKQVAAAKAPEQIPLDLLAAFGFAGVQNTTKRNANLNDAATKQRRDEFFKAIRDPAHLTEIEREFREFLKPLQRTGVLLSLSIPNVNPTDLRTLRIRNPDGQYTDRLLSGVQLAQLLSSDGRLGETWAKYPALVPMQPELEAWMTTHLPETLTYDDLATQDARELARRNTPEVKNSYKTGNLLVNPGTVIDQDHLTLLTAEYDAFESTITEWQRWVRCGVVAIVIILLGFVNGFYLVRNEPTLVRSASRLSVYLSVLVVAVALGRALSFDPWRAEVIPITATVMIFAIAYNQFLATLTGFSLSLILAFSTGADLGHFVVLIGAASMIVIPLTQVSSRSTLINVGFGSAVAYFVVSWGVAVIENQSLVALFENNNLLVESLRGAAWCLASGFLVAGSLPFIENLFGVVTNISLLELGDVSHPLLSELVRRAPGTYNHSIAVASIGETAADSIGANGLLVKIGAYFHDIGKMVKPHYFVENMVIGEPSRHSQLAPAMSTLIIIGHVKDGVDLAEKHGLPRPVIDFIEQHHGTTLVEYFYHAATKQAGEHPDQGYEVLESAFRYPGPKPQTRELAVMMLSDAVESASRTLSEPTPKRIETLVNEIARKRLLDGQFEECGLTLTELNLIQDSLIKSLNAIYHGRIKYPEQRSA